MESAKIYQQVNDHYGTASRSTATQYGQTVAKSFGYTEEELSTIPKEANLGLSCGNPLAIATLQEVWMYMATLGKSADICAGRNRC
jgi:arsenite methyltransferase